MTTKDDAPYLRGERPLGILLFGPHHLQKNIGIILEAGAWNYVAFKGL